MPDLGRLQDLGNRYRGHDHCRSVAAQGPVSCPFMFPLLTILSAPYLMACFTTYLHSTLHEVYIPSWTAKISIGEMAERSKALA